MNNINNLINGHIFAENSQILMKSFVDIIFSWRFLITITLFFIAKYLYFFIKSHALLLYKKKIKLHKRIQSILSFLQEDIQNIICGGIGILFTWTIITSLLTILPLGLHKVNWLNNYNNIIISPQQIEFAKMINHFMSYFALIEVILIGSAFLMLIFSFLGGVFKTAAKITGSIAIILYALAIFVSSYVSIILEITK